MTEIQQNRWDQLIRRVAGIVGGGSQVNDTLNELFPVLDVENVPIELLALQPTNVGWCHQTLLASVGDQNHHQLFNPAGSNSLLVVTSIFFSSTTSQRISVGNISSALTTAVGNKGRRDTRAGIPAPVVGQSRSVQQAAGGQQDISVRVIANETFTLSDQNGIAVVFPGTGCNVTTRTTNTESTCSFLWRERVFQPSERISRG